MLGKTRESSAKLIDVQAELYRANHIENYDTAAIRCHTEDGVEILFYTAHPVPDTIGPVLSYEFEHAVVILMPQKTNCAPFHNGQTKEYGNPSENDAHKLWQAVDAVRTGMPLACGVMSASEHTRCINGAQESVDEITTFPEDLVHIIGDENDTLTWVTGLKETMETCYDKGLLPSEGSSVTLGSRRTTVDLRNYQSYPSK